MHQLLAEPVSGEDGNYYGPVKKSMQSYYGLNSLHTAAGSLPSQFGLNVGIGDFVRCINVPHGESKNRSWKAERKEYEEKLAHDLIMGHCPWLDQGSCNLYHPCSTATNTFEVQSNTFEHCPRSYDDEKFNDACKSECYAIPVVVENMNPEFKADATCVSYECSRFVADDESTSSSEECIPLVVEMAEPQAKSLDPCTVSDVIPTIVENLVDDFFQSAMPVVSTASLPASLLRVENDTNATPHARTIQLPIKSYADRLFFCNVNDQGDERLPLCVAEVGGNDSLAIGCPTDHGCIGFDRGWIAPAQCADGGDLPTVLDFVERSPVHSSPELNADFSCALQSSASFGTQVPFIDINWPADDVPAAQQLVAQSRDCSPLLHHWYHQPTQAVQLQKSDKKKKNNPARVSRKWPEKVAAGSPRRRRLDDRRQPEWSPFLRETARPAAAATAFPSTSALELNPWHASSTTTTPYRAADSTHASGLQNGSVATCGDFPYDILFG